MKKIENRFAQKRLELGLTLEQAASGICSVSYLSMIEAGKREPSKAINASLCYRLGLAVDVEEEPSAGFNKALLAIKLGQFDDVSLDLPNLTERDFIQAELWMATGFIDKALEVFLSLTANPAASDLIRLKAAVSGCYCAVIAGDYHLAIQIGESSLKEFLNENDDLFELRATLANAYVEVGDFARAMTLVNQHAKILSGWQRVMQLWSQQYALENAGRFEEAAVLVAQALELLAEVDRPAAKANMLQTQCWLEVLSGVADIALIRSRLDEADLIFKNLTNSGGLAMSLDTRALAEALYGDRSIAGTAIETALNLIGNQETGTRAKILITSARISQLNGDFEAAKQQLLEARAILANGKAGRSEAKSWRLMAEIYEELGDSTSVIACLKAATDLLGLGYNSVSVV